jgi:acetyl esterase/lipase
MQVLTRAPHDWHPVLLAQTSSYNFSVYNLALQLVQNNMAPYDDTTGETRFDSFHVFRTSFKKIGIYDIEVGILVPKDLKPGKHPIIVKYHGGGLVRNACPSQPE